VSQDGFPPTLSRYTITNASPATTPHCVRTSLVIMSPPSRHPVCSAGWLSAACGDLAT